jgi:hypothetical protein
MSKVEQSENKDKAAPIPVGSDSIGRRASTEVNSYWRANGPSQMGKPTVSDHLLNQFGNLTLDYGVPNASLRRAAAEIVLPRLGDLHSATTPESRNRTGGEANRHTDAIPAGAAQTKVSDLDKDRTHLLSAAQGRICGMDGFKKDMDTLEGRIKTGQISKDDAARTYEQVSRLLDARGDSPTNQTDRERLAAQVMHQAAEPGHINQGQHGTCNVTAVESRTYTKYPAEAAQLVADVALTGQFMAKDGSGLTVKVDPKPADQEAKENNLQDGDRSYASQLFQVTAVNLHWQSIPGMSYEQRPVTAADTLKGNTGDVLLSGQKVYLANNPDLASEDLVDIGNKISGHHDAPFVLIKSDHSGVQSKDAVSFRDERDLSRQLLAMKNEGQLPAILHVHSDREPFYTDRGGGNLLGAKDGHVVTIRDYNPETGKVMIDNQWGSWANHDTAETSLDLHDLYRATLSNADYKQALDHDIRSYKKEGKPTDSLELALLQARHDNASGKDKSYDGAINERTNHLIRNWDKVTEHLSPTDKDRLYNQIVGAEAGTSASNFAGFLERSAKDGFMSQEDFHNRIAYSLAHEFDNDGHAIPLLRRMVNDMSPEDRSAVLMSARQLTTDDAWRKWAEPSWGQPFLIPTDYGAYCASR